MTITDFPTPPFLYPSRPPPKDPKDDKALQTALALLRGTETNPAFPPNAKQAATTVH